MTQPNFGYRVFLTLLLLLTARGVCAQEAKPDVFFGKHVEPILVKHCLECHGSDRKGGLDLRSSQTALAGGESGAVIEPGKPDDSLLIEHLVTGEMPPKKALDPKEIAAIKTWIAAGAWFPDRQLDPYAFSSDHRAGYDWWSLRPVERPTPPKVKHVDRVLSDIDRFVLARLETEGLSLAPPAARATYIRRVTYDLIGLLPTQEEVEQFVTDQQSDAFEKLVDRLLESPHYGERWGRHWLDVVRFAESNGFERDRIRRNFWPYRDYVIRSFNEDKPYDQFVVEQLAGDAIDPNDAESRIALGFLAAGPKNDVGTISELERMRTRQDELDEVVVATGTTFLGLTVGCARCHDHKFDPISARDYYALTAVFSGCEHSSNVVVATPEERQRHDQQVSSLRNEVSQKREGQKNLLEAARRQILAMRTHEKPDENQPDLPAVSPRRNEDTFPPVKAKFIRFTITRTNSSQPCLDELEIFGPASDANLALAAAGSKATASSLLPGYEIHQIHHLNDGKHGNSHSWISNESGGWAQIELAEAADINRVAWGRDREGRFTDRVPIGYRVEVSLDNKSWTKVSDAARRPSSSSRSADGKIADPEVVASLAPAQRKSYYELDRAIKELEKHIKAIPPLPTAYSISDGKGSAEVPVLKRGDVRSHGDSVSAAALSAIAGLERNLSAESGPQRRLKLAQWITNPANPLTARVFVNRVWQHHFGRGIVDTPSDFGFKGGQPSHPKLLDWLAADFVQHGWKIKHLHRQIVLSATYRQGSEHHAAATELDAGNRLLWRYAPHRLEAEAVRDIILQLSGKLDRTLGGPSFELFTYRDGNVPDYQMVERPGAETWRRSVYRYNIRTFRSPLMATFDCPDPSVSTPSRPQSTNPLQALSLLNNYFVVQQAELMADRVRNSVGPDAVSQVIAAYRLVLLREPTQAEHDRAASFVKEHGLAGLCRALVNGNEFLYVF